MFALLTLAQGFSLLDYIPQPKTTFKPCEGLDNTLLTYAHDIAEDITSLGLFDVSIGEGTNSICSKSNTHYGYITPYENHVELTISTDLLYVSNTLYNVLYHEMLHSIGLDHSIKPGLMSYSVNTRYDSPINDQKKLYPSIDDIQGIRASYKRINSTKFCQKRKIIKLLNDCN